MENELWHPYLSLCLQNLSPLPASLSIWASGSAKGKAQTFCETHKGWDSGLKSNVPNIWDKRLKFEPESGLSAFVKSAPGWDLSWNLPLAQNYECCFTPRVKTRGWHPNQSEAKLVAAYKWPSVISWIFMRCFFFKSSTHKSLVNFWHQAWGMR